LRARICFHSAIWASRTVRKATSQIQHILCSGIEPKCIVEHAHKINSRDLSGYGTELKFIAEPTHKTNSRDLSGYGTEPTSIVELTHKTNSRDLSGYGTELKCIVEPTHKTNSRDLSGYAKYDEILKRMKLDRYH
jgi:hypothetical protein